MKTKQGSCNWGCSWTTKQPFQAETSKIKALTVEEGDLHWEKFTIDDEVAHAPLHSLIVL
jgi:hypothetical protein